MQNPHLMSREELLELSEADTLGILDEYEAALFTRSFHHAPIPVQDEIRDLQEMQALNPVLLASDEPSAGLGDLVVARVLRAIEDDNSELAPLATIGRGRREMDRGGTPFVLSRSWQFWRAACFAMAAGLLIVSYLLVDASLYQRQVTTMALGRDTDDSLRKLLGPTFNEFVGNSSCEYVTMVAVDPRVRGNATLMVNSNAGKVFVLGLELPDDIGELTVAYTDVAGSVHPVGSLNVSPTVTGARFDALSSAALAASSWVILDSSGTVLLQAA